MQWGRGSRQGQRLQQKAARIQQVVEAGTVLLFHVSLTDSHITQQGAPPAQPAGHNASSSCPIFMTLT